MKAESVVDVLTALSAVVVVLTRLRLTRPRAAGRARIGMGWVNAHTVAGVVAVVCWVVFLVTGHDNSILGVVGLFCYWLTAIAGLMLLIRWLPSRGRHASRSHDGVLRGTALSVLAHVGMLVAVLVFTWYFATHG